MQVEVVFHPRDLRPEHLRDRAVVVLDVLRATTTMIAALHAGAKEIRIFGSLDSARAAAREWPQRTILCGEERCRKPEDFDLGNSPGDFCRDTVQGKTLFMSTTNGTRAIVAARSAPLILIGALTNARATAEMLINLHMDVTLLCAGTDGQVSLEDVLGAGAILNSAMRFRTVALGNDEALLASRADLSARDKYPTALRTGAGGRHIIAAGLEADIEFAADVDSIDIVGRVDANPLTVRRHVVGGAR
ncbi:2-phosphosulfolactate phosphatase family protein [soil metagenome]